jgi:hypothetical protein
MFKSYGMPVNLEGEIQKLTSRKDFRVQMRAKLNRPPAHGEEPFEDGQVRFSLEHPLSSFRIEPLERQVLFALKLLIEAEAHPKDEYRHPRLRAKAQSPVSIQVRALYMLSA